MNYNTIVSSLRTAARDLLRLKATNRLRDTLLELNTEINQANKAYESTVAQLTKAVAVANYKLGLVEDTDPEATEKRKRLEMDAQYSQEAIEPLTKTHEALTERLNKAIAEVNEAIAKVQSGETLVSMDELSAVTSQFITEVANEAVKSKLAETLAADVTVN
jgi:hypothetical protein